MPEASRASASGPGASYRIREAVPTDAPRLAEVHIRSWQAAYRGIVPQAYLDGLSSEIPAREARWREMFDRLPRDVALVGEIPEDGIVGFCRVGAARPPHFGMTGEVGAIYLLPEYWGRGLGRRLMGSGADALERLGFGSAVVWVLTENPARRFYERLGGLRRGTTVHRMAGGEFGVTAYIWPQVRRLSERCAPPGSDTGGPPE